MHALSCIWSAMSCHLLHHSAKNLHVFAIAIANQPTVPAVLLYNVKGLTKYSLYLTPPTPLFYLLSTFLEYTRGLARDSNLHLIHLDSLVSHTWTLTCSYLDSLVAHTWSRTRLTLGLARGSHLDFHMAHTWTHTWLKL
jgi:hypothetical protein